ncbi:Lysophospholipid acyltransferase LPCAT4 [Micractinium conductrix]|uniref:Lysophospholipid acyltransferase LPCAT4 n=1 Tax=Micractinium conductrix TaxID=554055 RepID=A0A2P6V7M5_9CHLO|nr:Lysophospholipid acyltransferase LPCAT4 [Micractinium conductrix]|eukprot:PSC70078.1 Lysophospholipid acyltransferase LPCAT4 [Micractinium conductrix]
MAPVVVFKVLLLAAAVPYAWAILWLLMLGHKPQTPMRPFRQLLVRQWIHQWGRFLLFVAGFYYVPVKGWHNMRAAEECRAILVFNHPSYVDAAAIATFFTPSGVSKAGVASIPFIGLFGIALQLFFIERKGSGDKANRHVLKGDAVHAIADRAADRKFPLLALAPEATTKAQPCLLKFRRGAFAAGQPVCPVLLKYSYRHFNPGWGIVNTPFHLYRLMAQLINHLEITVLPPYFPSDEEQKDWALYAENVRSLMGKELGVPLVEEGFAEERQMWRARVGVNLRGTRQRARSPSARHPCSMTSTSALQRLRQGQSSQLLSLVQWASQQQMRGLASDARQAVEFAKKRKGFQGSLSELRKQWAAERQEREAARAAAELAEREARAAAKAQRAEADLQARAARLTEYKAQQAAERELRMAAKAERLKRAELRAEILDVAREERRRALERQSAHWVTPQTLEARIAEALSNPVPLHADLQAHARLQEFGPLTPQSSLERPPTLPPLKLHALPPLTDLPEPGTPRTPTGAAIPPPVCPLAPHGPSGLSVAPAPPRAATPACLRWP